VSAYCRQLVLSISYSYGLWALGLLGLASVPAVAQTQDQCRVSLMWDANSEPDLAGYVVLIGKAPRVYTQSVEVGVMDKPTQDLDLPNGFTYYFAVRAFNTAGLVSEYSNEVTTVCDPGTPPPPPYRIPLRITGITGHIIPEG
jgi:hypothetical protein